MSLVGQLSLPGGRPAQDGALRVPQVGPGRVRLPDDVILLNLSLHRAEERRVRHEPVG